MPIHYRSDGKPVVELDPLLEISPFTLFRRLQQGRPLQLIDVREQPSGATLEGARPLPSGDWEPDGDEDVVLFDDDGTRAVAVARELQSRGFESVRALFGGLDLYGFSLDPEVVGQQTFLIPVEP